MDVELALETARRAADAASLAAMRHFRSGAGVRLKDDRSPVTAADQEAEAAILGVIGDTFPDHDVLAEESGAHERGSEFRWLVDPLDGTRGFSRGGTFWGPLIAVERNGEVLAGALALPALGRTYYAAKDLGCWGNGRRLRVSAVDSWRDATLSLGELSRLLRPPYRDGVVALATSAASTRCFGDLAAVTMLLDGRAEAWIEAGVKPWDVAPMAILVPEAGGTFADFDGGTDYAKGGVIATNSVLRDHVQDAFA